MFTDLMNTKLIVNLKSWPKMKLVAFPVNKSKTWNDSITHAQTLQAKIVSKTDVILSQF